jgi:hypothetical protein
MFTRCAGVHCCSRSRDDLVDDLGERGPELALPGRDHLQDGVVRTDRGELGLERADRSRVRGWGAAAGSRCAAAAAVGRTCRGQPLASFCQPSPPARYAQDVACQRDGLQVVGGGAAAARVAAVGCPPADLDGPAVGEAEVDRLVQVLVRAGTGRPGQRVGQLPVDGGPVGVETVTYGLDQVLMRGPPGRSAGSKNRRPSTTTCRGSRCGVLRARSTRSSCGRPSALAATATSTYPNGTAVAVEPSPIAFAADRTVRTAGR